MKKLLVSTVVALSVSVTGFSQMMGGMHGSQGGMGQQMPMQQPYGYYYQPMPMMMPMMGMMGMHGGGMMGMGGMGMMGGMGGMYHDPETQKLIREHMQKCRKELMQKLAKRRAPQTAERMLHMMTMHPEAFKEALKKNPQLRKKLKELLK